DGGGRLPADVERGQPPPALQRTPDERAQRAHGAARVGLVRGVAGRLDVHGEGLARRPPPSRPEIDQAAACGPDAPTVQRGREDPFDGRFVVRRQRVRGRAAASRAGRARDRGYADHHAGDRDPESRCCSACQLTISTGVPSGRTFESLTIWSLSMRMQPWVTLLPSTDESLLPWTPTSASPPLYSVSTSEWAESPYANGPYTVFGSGAWISTRV